MSDRTILEQPSAWPFAETLDRLTRAISGAGMQVFATIDHARNARDAGLDMPASTVLIYGKAQGGTPLMLSHPRIALDLPLRVLVREEGAQTYVALHPVAAMLEASGVSASDAARLEPAQALMFKTIQP